MKNSFKFSQFSIVFLGTISINLYLLLTLHNVWLGSALIMRVITINFFHNSTRKKEFFVVFIFRKEISKKKIHTRLCKHVVKFNCLRNFLQLIGVSFLLFTYYFFTFTTQRTQNFFFPSNERKKDFNFIWIIEKNY